MYLLYLHVVAILAGGNNGLIGEPNIFGGCQYPTGRQLPLLILLKGLDATITGEIPDILNLPQLPPLIIASRYPFALHHPIGSLRARHFGWHLLLEGWSHWRHGHLRLRGVLGAGQGREGRHLDTHHRLEWVRGEFGVETPVDVEGVVYCYDCVPVPAHSLHLVAGLHLVPL